MDKFNNLTTSSIKTSFLSELQSLKKAVEVDISLKDYQHLKKIILINRIFLIVGLGTAWILINPISMLFIALSLHGQWCIVAHHVMHGGYDKITPVRRYHSKYFALRWRRFIDWFDLIYPPAWKIEHNTLHHFYINENLDPDIPSLHLRRNLNEAWPLWLRFIKIFFIMLFWKIIYYSLNTLKAYHEKKNYDLNVSLKSYVKKAFIHSYLPYFSFHFLLIPMLFLPLGWNSFWFVLINRIGAEIIANVHSFLVIVPNHCGSDISLNSTHFKNKEDFYLRQILGTCNFKTGGFWNDYFHGYLNYQIEHHLFSNLPVSQYVKLQPKVQAICKKYNIEYKQESLFKRIKKTFRVLLLLDTPMPNKVI